MPAPNAAALLRRNATDGSIRGPAGDEVRRPRVDPRRVLRRSRPASPQLFLDRLPAGRALHVAVLLDNTPDYLFAFGGAALIGGAVVGLNHTRRDEHLLRDIEHTHCGLLVTEPRHEALLAPIADALPPIARRRPLRRRRRPAADAGHAARRRARAASAATIPGSSPTSTRSGR